MTRVSGAGLGFRAVARALSPPVENENTSE